MQISRPDEKTVRLSRLDALLTDLLRRIPASADPGENAAARERLYSSPTRDPEEADLLDDWRQFVEPEQRRIFLSNVEIIATDLRELRVEKAKSHGTISIPVAHLEGWIHGLNQARLALAARHDFTEGDMEQNLPLSAGDPRAVALLQVRFYGILQELFLRELEGD